MFRGPEDWEKSCGSKGLGGRCRGSRWRLSWWYSRDAQGFLVDQGGFHGSESAAVTLMLSQEKTWRGNVTLTEGVDPRVPSGGNCVWSAEGRGRRVRFRSFIWHWVGSFQYWNENVLGTERGWKPFYFPREPGHSATCYGFNPQLGEGLSPPSRYEGMTVRGVKSFSVYTLRVQHVQRTSSS